MQSFNNEVEASQESVHAAEMKHDGNFGWAQNQKLNPSTQAAEHRGSTM